MTILLPAVAQAQQDKKSILQGNEYYRQQQYDEAAAAYQRSLGNNGLESVVGNFNLGAAWYKQKKLDDAVQQFTDIAGSATDKTLKAKAYHNLGNALLESQKLEESIEAYKKSLLNNPKDDETRYNLAYAQEKLKQQQQQQNNQDQQNDKKDQDNKDQNQNNKDQDNKDQDNKDPDQDKKDQDQNKDNPNDKNDSDNGKNDQQQSQPGQLSKADAERLLEAMNQEEKNTQEKLKKKKGTGQGKVVKQW
ncbi:tetratricopeptide repeat protein [Parapedobacter indicus]|uniref:Tetratricopeptide repeat-containing protein n=1 Tax=Parapedobacter indicus TaxID=1477437 RepID=A0A1I3TUD1_9SPHI|nr:tetratricopeptide repeat protein [Parapedobacter indicus]PPK99395.1 tetratricopeptide repeat protein [Parapedobacter indicus]SFJ73939.1 Tetratricopeptide repeat-containing protein [Parapedobacter indicus]